MKTTAIVILSTAVAAGPALGGPVQSFGKPLQGLAPSSLETVLAKPEDGRVVRLEGEVQKVCQSKGCWLELKQGALGVRVTFAGYSFFVPKDSAGKRVAVEGKVVVQKPSADEVKHLTGEGASAPTLAGVSVEAYGVAIGQEAK